MAKIVLIGAGSVVFAKNVIADMLWHESMADAHLVVVDIDPERLDTAYRMANSIRETLGRSNRIEQTADRRAALDGADFVICTIGVGGIEATRIDHQIPAQFGVRQTVADTLGPGGVFRSARSVPVLLDICHDMEELCPHALLLNYTNPMATHCLAVARATKIRHVGLCHGVRNTARTLRMMVGMLDRSSQEIYDHFDLLPDSEERIAQWLDWWELGDDPNLSYTVAGINHQAYFLRFESDGKDLYPLLRQMLSMPHMRRLDPVRFELFERLGYFMTETSAHTSEYQPYFLKDADEVKRMHLTVSSYLTVCEQQDQAYQSIRRSLLNGEPAVSTPYELSVEYAGRIINAVLTDTPYVFNGNVHNQGGHIITNLPGDSCVEVPCLADAQGVRPTFFGDLPPQCAALIRNNINVQDLTVRGILENNKQTIRQAVMVDPNTASTLTLPKIWEMCDAMFEAHHDALPLGLR